MRTSIRALSLLLVAAALVPASQSAQATSTPALPAFCTIAEDANTWKGAGITPGATAEFENGANWSTGTAPLFGDKDVCIPSGGVPVIAAGEEAQLATLDIDGGATLTVQSGGKVFLFGSQTADEDSVVRDGGRLDVVGGTLGGIAKLHVIGDLLLENAGPGAAATVLTRDCSYDTTPGPPYPGEEACATPGTPVEGPTFLLEVADQGELAVDGGGVNLGDQAAVVTRGLFRVRPGAFVAADRGTALELRPHLTALAGTGTLRFEGDGGYLEGKTLYADSALSRVVNQGRIVKAAGSGRTLVSASYSQPSPGAVTVSTGTLLLPTGPSTAAFADGGTTYGTGRCTEPLDPACQTTTTPDPGFQQSAELRVPTADTSGARVVVRRLGTRSSVDLGFPHEVHATSMSATASAPAIIRLRFDASVLKGKRWSTVKVLRKAGTNPYRVVKACTSTGRPPSGEVACVDRRGLAGSSRNVANASGAPDVIMVVRTTRTSRWVGR